MPVDPKIPQPPPPRVIVLCFDGTSSQFDETNTNIVKFHGLLKKNPLQQIVYYQAGVGTYINPGVVSPWFTPVAKIMDALFASYLDDHVKSGYKFLMQNYREGDEVCVFGFSRGAHTARALTGLLHKIGLLPRDNDEQIAFAYSLYKATDNKTLADGFKETFCTPVPIKFIGVWETVSSVGLVYGSELPFSAGHSDVEFFRHALALDERRARFQPRLYRIDKSEETAKRMSCTMSASHVNAIAVPRSPESSEMANSDRRPGPRLDVVVRRLCSQEQYQIPGITRRTPSNANSLIPERDEPPTTSPPPPGFLPVQEVWFSGCHSDVGGGSVEDAVRYSLGDISLRWMIKQVRLSGCRIEFDPKALRAAEIEIVDIFLPSPAQQTVEQLRDGGGDPVREGKKKEAEEQILPQEPEVLTDIHDGLDFSWSDLGGYLGFWFLELIVPVTFIWQDANGRDKRKRGWNRGNRRIIHYIRRDPIYVHESVRQRTVTDPEYKPKWQRTFKKQFGDQQLEYVH